MSKKLFAVLLLGSVMMLILVACSTTSAATSGLSNQVHMNASNFVQSSITIKKGESITLINDNPFVAHTIANGTWENGAAKVVREAGAPPINDVQIGGSSSATVGPFTTAGTFKLYCTVHADMNLTVVVE